MANLYNTDLGQNTRNALPTSNLGTREIVWMCLAADDDFWQGGNYLEPNSNYSQVVRQIQRAGELFYLGAPDAGQTDSFVFALATDTNDAAYSEQNEDDFTDAWDVNTNEPNYVDYMLYEYYGDGLYTLNRLNALGGIID